MAHAKGLLAPTGTKARALALLAEAKMGLTSRDIASRLEIDLQRASNAMSELSRTHVVAGIIEGGQGKANQTRRWCLPDQVESIRTAKQTTATKSKAWQKSGLGQTPYRERKAVNLGQAKVTVCPGYADNTAPTEPPKLFRAMKPGRYLETGSAIERAYAARGK